MVYLAFCAGLLCFYLAHLIIQGNYKRVAEKIMAKATADAREMELRLKARELEAQIALEKMQAASRALLKEDEVKLQIREDKIEERINLIEKKLQTIDKKEMILVLRKERLEEESDVVRAKEKHLNSTLESLSGLTSDEAKNILLERVQKEVKQDAILLSRKIIAEAYDEAENKARRIIATAINRYGAASSSEASITTVNLPSDDIKGRIIGKEGRNIKALELATGMNFLIDDTPGVVVISGFDPIRRQIAKLALGELIQDGRIHPTRIEEAVEKSKENLEQQIKSFGEDAAFRSGVIGLHPAIILLLGKLKFRYSLGQNVLDHSLEVSHLMGVMAQELGLDASLAKKIGLLHDMGKAVTHEVEGSHAIIGHDLALRYGESELVANGIGCHHMEMEAKTIEASLCSSADAISGSRPGARVEAIEHYIKRLSQLETIATDISGVTKAYAMQAGREIRIFVEPGVVDDQSMVLIARDVAKKIAQTLSYPGKIKVTVIREQRAVEYAL